MGARPRDTFRTLGVRENIVCLGSWILVFVQKKREPGLGPASYGAKRHLLFLGDRQLIFRLRSCVVIERLLMASLDRMMQRDLIPTRHSAVQT